MLFVPSAAAKHHHHRLPEQLNTLQTSAKDDAKKSMPLKFNVKKTVVPCTAQPTMVKEAVNNNNNKQVDILTHQAAVKQQSAEIVEAMRKLDAKLVAYLSAADNDNAVVDSAVDNKPTHVNNNNNTHGVIVSSSIKCGMEQHVNELSLDNDGTLPCAITHLIEDFAAETSTLTAAKAAAAAAATDECQLDKFRRVNALKLQMEALTLQPDGIKYMDLLETEIRPIFTVECQLSHELINSVPRYDMFHVMQFESGKFHSLTQCTRFGQEALREVRLQLSDANGNESTAIANDDQLNIGRIRFSVWWREPGTCINEMLGIGVLELAELYELALLEQCMSIKVYKRGIHFGSLYFKISLLLQRPMMMAETMQLSDVSVMQSYDPFAHQHDNGNDENGNDGGNAEQQQQQNNNKSMNNQQQQQQQAGNNGGSGGNSNDGNSIETANTAGHNAVNNSQLLESSHFSAETSQVRLLKGFLYANETRNLSLPSDAGDGDSDSAKSDYILVCRRFWQDEAAATAAGQDNAFNYQEQFSIINDQRFLQSVHKRHLQLELWRRTNPVNDDNCNPKESTAADDSGSDNVEPFGLVHLPLHHFFIAYRDAAIANHICKGRMPVISIDAWVTIQQPNDATTNIGELKCLLAIGSEEQISHLKATRGFSDISKTPLSPVKHFSISKVALDAAAAKVSCPAHMQPSTIGDDGNGKHAGLLDILQKVLKKGIMIEQSQPDAVGTTVKSPPPSKSYQLLLDIRAARNLPYNTVKRKKGAKRRNGNAAAGTAGGAAKRNGNGGTQAEAPTCYVTFQADACVGQSTYKSHEGQVYATSVVESCCHPKWDAQFRLSVDSEYLTNPQKCFVLKVWRKTAQSVANQSRPLQPTPMDDAIVGFVALDLTAFRRGAAHIDGWFNIIDFNGRINGQLDVRCITQPPAQVPMTNVTMAAQQTTPIASTSAAAALAATGNVDEFIDQFENSLDLTHLNIGQAIKRKYTELEGISQRLRTRLANITGESLSQTFDMDVLNEWQKPDDMAAELTDADWDEFEHDICTTPPPIDATNNNTNNNNINTSSCSSTNSTELNAHKAIADSTITEPEAEHGE